MEARQADPPRLPARAHRHIEPSAGSRGDSYDNALAETIIGLYKAEVSDPLGPWMGLEAVEYAALEWVAWYHSQRLMAPLGYLPPAEYEARYHRVQARPPGLGTHLTEPPVTPG